MMDKFKLAKIKLIIGLGNSGREYEKTYHNAGFLFIDLLHKELVRQDSKFQAFELVKSESFMNESGNFVRKTINKKGVEPENLLIVHDDSDIAFGQFKISFGGSSAGHKGIQSIIQHLGTEKFWRIRIGIRKSSILQRAMGIKRQRAKARQFVLKTMSTKDKKSLESVFENIISLLPQQY